MRQLKYEQLEVVIADDDPQLGALAADDFASAANFALSHKKEVAVILSLGAAQPTFFPALIARTDIDWSRIVVFHVDTYMGVANDRPESGAVRLREHLLDAVKPKQFFAMDGAHEPVEEEIERYSLLLEKWDPDVCVVGVGRSGHLAFCDPPADFSDSALVRAVALTPISRNQILDVGYFKQLRDVPEFGLTLSMHALVRPRRILALAHQKEKAAILKRGLEEPVSIMRPFSLLKRQPHARMYLSPAAASELGGDGE